MGFTNLAAIYTGGTMAAKRTVYTSETAAHFTVRRGEVQRLKTALRKMFSEYRLLKKQQRRFEVALGEVCALTIKWTIPRKELELLRREFGPR
jgi:hypothetical protein